jgi:hypothetical protein
MWASVAVPGGDDAGDFAADDFFAGAGSFHLLADGDAVAFGDEAGEVAIGGVVGDAGHGDGLFGVFIAGGEGDFEFAGGDDGVVHEELVEVAHAEEEQGAGHLLFDAVILPHERRGFGGHAQA